jgi:hypothetical protein
LKPNDDPLLLSEGDKLLGDTRCFGIESYKITSGDQNVAMVNKRGNELLISLKETANSKITI